MPRTQKFGGYAVRPTSAALTFATRTLYADDDTHGEEAFAAETLESLTANTTIVSLPPLHYHFNSPTRSQK